MLPSGKRPAIAVNDSSKFSGVEPRRSTAERGAEQHERAECDWNQSCASDSPLVHRRIATDLRPTKR